ncbi:hypothetical protein [Cyclobacterium roseum]|uniref:hypothetical protein n=1 Tax=Cyclobacterium roseum TaxID=2666137 RepID=UPI001390D0B8|nr:hypothetical protein [Cyclobacterium roseum]
MVFKGKFSIIIPGKMENIANMNATVFEEHLEKRYGAPGTDQGIAFESVTKAFAIYIG